MNKKWEKPTNVGIVGNDADVSCNERKKKQSKKLIKVLGASGLAILMGAGVLCGTIIAPMNSTQTAISGGATASSNSADNASAAQLGDSAHEEWSAGILSGNLNLDPENDPVVYTTDYGLDIRWHMASPLPTDPSDIATTTVSSTAWAYFTAGGNNWIIIGCSNKSADFSTGTLNLSTLLEKGYYEKPSYYNFTTTSGNWEWIANIDKDTSAGNAVYNDSINIGKDEIYNLVSQTITQKSVFTNAAATDELETNEVLCLLSGKYKTTTQFGNRGVYYSSSGVSSNLRTFINGTIYPLVEDLPIVPQPLTTAGSTSTTEHLFPLGSKNASGDSFPVENYLNSETKQNIGAYWWSRSYSSASRAYIVSTSGGVIADGNPSSSYGVRPAFVLKI